MSLAAITVTAEHIARGQLRDCSKCPVALALHDAIPHVSDIEVEADHVTFRLGCRTEAYLLPPEARDFIEAFDNQEAEYGPFTFEMWAPDPDEPEVAA